MFGYLVLFILAAAGYVIGSRVARYYRLKTVFNGMPVIQSAWLPILSYRIGTYEKVLKEMTSDPTHSPFFGFGPNLFGVPVVAIIDPEAIKEILSDEHRFPKTTFKDNLLGDGLVMLTGDRWKRERRRLTPTFHFGALQDALGYMIEEADRFCAQVQAYDGKATPAKDVFSSLTLRVIIRYSFGGEFDLDWMEEKWKQIMDSFVVHILIVMSLGDFAPYIPAQWNKTVGLMNEVSVKTRELIKKKRDRLHSTGNVDASKSDLVELLVNASETEDEITDQFIIDEAKTFLLAGHETTSNLLAWSAYFVSIHPEVMKKARQEIDSVLGTFDPNNVPKMGPEEVPKLRYIKAILEETQRLMPIVPALATRYCAQDETLLGHVFPKGTEVAVFPTVNHFTTWENSQEFQPERFMPDFEDAKKRHAYAYIPFSAGPRNCIGQKFAIQEAVVVLGKLIQRFDIDSQGQKPTIKINPTSTPYGLNLKFYPRK
eukprot:TRINITY_DN7407_c0_g1_i1.p1 TRINITY_DN7407_c0_g1~~TRINITY_DN7407_c0_g1_i1.p1  ORF type:complete len:485 (+),score=137.09 TRINITY_DN7407_c0_g1_i1:18-1472(+)